MKILTFAVAVAPPSASLKPVMIEYPELDAWIKKGYEIADVLPGFGSNEVYYLTVQLEKVPKKGRSQ